MQVVHSNEEWGRLLTGVSHGLQMRHGLGESLQQCVAALSKINKGQICALLEPQDNSTQGGDMYGWHEWYEAMVQYISIPCSLL